MKEEEKKVEKKKASKEEVKNEKLTIKEKLQTFGTFIKTLAMNNKKILIIVAIALVILILLSNIFLARSAKSTVKDVAKVAQDINVVGAADLFDPEGILAFYSCYDFENNEVDLDDFDEHYKKIQDAYKKIRKELKKCKYSIKVTDTNKVSDAKKLTKVTCDVELKYKGHKIKLTGLKIYTMKKGIKNYIIGIDPKSIEKIGDQLEDQSDDLEDIADELKDIADDLEDILDF